MTFTDLFGNAPHARVLDFLLERPEFDHNIMDISRGADVARPTTYKVVQDLLKQRVLVETRTLGNSRMFRLDLDSPAVRRLNAARSGDTGPIRELGASDGPRRSGSPGKRHGRSS